MSTVARVEEERWLLPLVVAVVLALVASVALVKLGPQGTSTAEAASAGTISLAAENQVPWDVTTSLVGTLGPATKSERDKMERQGPLVMNAVAKLYKALFLAPDRLGDVVRKTVAPRAAAALRDADLLLPQGIHDVRIFKRIARVGIGAAGAKTAVAEVLLKLRGETATRTLHVLHRAHLWLERTPAGWRVIAFDVDQGPIR